MGCVCETRGFYNCDFCQSQESSHWLNDGDSNYIRSQGDENGYRQDNEKRSQSEIEHDNQCWESGSHWEQQNWHWATGMDEYMEEYRRMECW